MKAAKAAKANRLLSPAQGVPSPPIPPTRGGPAPPLFPGNRGTGPKATPPKAYVGPTATPSKLRPAPNPDPPPPPEPGSPLNDAIDSVKLGVLKGFASGLARVAAFGGSTSDPPPVATSPPQGAPVSPPLVSRAGSRLGKSYLAGVGVKTVTV